nr:MAG TPA: hypothetical protein [Caudoviricetes sp.]
MSKYKILSDEGVFKASGSLQYNGSYLKPSYVEFKEIVSPTPALFQVGDYVDYDRTGLRYRLYSIPQPKKQARRGSVGDAFVYENVQLFAATKMLERAIFHDVVKSDNGIHFSTRESLTTYEDVYGIVSRIQECVDEIYPDAWIIKVMDGITEDSAPELYAQLREQKEFSITGTCLDALTNIYNTWDGIGWVHTFDSVSGKDVITIGRPNVRTDENTTSPFIYGRGNGLTAIKKSYVNSEEMATRLYVYGSERNLINRYYNGKKILNAESVDIVNLMLPISSWGKSADSKGNLLPDARKAYIEDESAVNKYGLIPKRVYFDGGDNEEVYPSIEGLTVKRLRSAKADLNDTGYVPSTGIYTDGEERLDEIKSAQNPADDGKYSQDGVNYERVEDLTPLDYTGNKPQYSTMFNFLCAKYGGAPYAIQERKTIVIEPDATIELNLPSEAVSCDLYYTIIAKAGCMQPVAISKTYSLEDVLSEEGVMMGRKISMYLPSMVQTFDGFKANEFPGELYVSVAVQYADTNKTEAELVSKISWKVKSENPILGIKKNFSETFSLTLKQIGFDIRSRQSTGNGLATISMKTGECAGRDFTVTACRYQKDTDDWKLTLKRTKDDSLNCYFPSSEHPIKASDRFVLLDIMMPELYIGIAADKLLSLANEMYEKVSKAQEYYEPEIDALRMVSSGQILTEGMYMAISDEDIIGVGNQYVLIDTLTIDESSEAIPTYKISLREKKGVSFKESVTNSLDSLSSRIVVIDGNVRQARYQTASVGSLASAVDDYSRMVYSQSQVEFIQTKETLGMLDRSVDSLNTSVGNLQNSVVQFTKGITPISVQTMALLVGSENLQFRFVNGFDDISDKVPYPIVFNNSTKKLVCTEAYIQHTTKGITNITAPGGRTASDYFIWKMPNDEIGALDGDLSGIPYYLYAKVRDYDKATATNADKTGVYVLSKDPHGINEEEGYLYLLIGVLSSEVDNRRALSKLHGFSEVLPGQIVTDIISSPSGRLVIDLKNGTVSGVVNFEAGSSGLGNVAGWNEMVKDVADNKKAIESNTSAINEYAYLKDLLNNGATSIAGGAILTNFIGIRDIDNPEKIAAGMNGSPVGQDATHGKLTFFSGSNSAKESDISKAKTRIYQDGALFSESADIKGTITAEQGKIAELDIVNSGITGTEVASGEGENQVKTSKIHLSPGICHYNQTTITKGSTQKYDVKIDTYLGESGLPSIIGWDGCGGGTIIKATGIPIDLVGQYFDVSGADKAGDDGTGNHALYINHGHITGFRLKVRRLSTSAYLNKLDSIILCFGSNTKVLRFPSDCEDGQMYIIRKCGAGAGDTGRVYYVCTGNDKLAPGQYDIGDTLLSANEQNKSASLTQGNAVMCVYDQAHKIWWCNEFNWRSS